MTRCPLKHAGKIVSFLLGAFIAVTLYDELLSYPDVSLHPASRGAAEVRVERSVEDLSDRTKSASVNHHLIAQQETSSGKFPKDATSETECQKHMTDFIQANMYSGICLECEANRDVTNDVCNGNTPICNRYETEGVMRREAFMNIFDEKPPKEGSAETWGTVTFVTQLSMNRFERIEKVAGHWTGAMSLAIYLKPHELWSLLVLSICKSPVLRIRRNIVYHISFNKGEFYPVNFLRNVALEGAQTDYVFLSDADLIPSLGLDLYLAQKLEANRMPQNTAWVVPAFEMLSLDYGRDTFPPDKKSLLRMEAKGHLLPFLVKFYLPAYNATDYDFWRTANASYKINYQQEFEPYVVMRTSEVPSYDERLIGRIRDKASHLFHVYASGIQYVVLHDVYTIHFPHQGRDKLVQVAKEYYKCSVDVFVNFLLDMMDAYPNCGRDVEKYIIRLNPRLRNKVIKRRKQQ